MGRRKKEKLVPVTNPNKEYAKNTHSDPVSNLRRLARELNESDKTLSNCLNGQAWAIHNINKEIMENSEDFEEEILEFLCDGDDSDGLRVRKEIPAEYLAALDHRIANRHQSVRVKVKVLDCTKPLIPKLSVFSELNDPTLEC